MDARAPVGERGCRTERHGRLRAGAQEAPEDYRDEQQGASGPHDGRARSKWPNLTVENFVWRSAPSKFREIMTKSGGGHPRGTLPRIVRTVRRVRDRAHDRGGTQRPPGQEDSRQVQVRIHAPNPTKCPPAPPFSPRWAPCGNPKRSERPNLTVPNSPPSPPPSQTARTTPSVTSRSSSRRRSAPGPRRSASRSGTTCTRTTSHWKTTRYTTAWAWRCTTTKAHDN